MQVIDGGELDINFIVETPTGRLVVPDIRKTSNLHKLAWLHYCSILVFWNLFVPEVTILCLYSE